MATAAADWGQEYCPIPVEDVMHELQLLPFGALQNSISQVHCLHCSNQAAC